ncbi:MAG TPA: hypothetical protein VFW93_01305 [Aquabacterium sp.]|uniref:hypothetical protein n=1 Tax=Aquabacterium sp. TaxID=1872578 RepID=UPI002E368A1B|nr:hypothetical protein [Aquabacterium sp.]HEX5354824.1 hypothetical protein [Aquabacterium sp.]
MSTNSRIAFGANAAQGISMQMARTWSETLVRDPRLLVPVHLDVLMVRQEGGTWARTGLFLNDAQQWQQPAPFTDLDQPRPKGAYLMWAPPDALARGRQAPGDTQGPLQFAGLPDRWLVLRVAPSARDSARRTVRGWVVRGDQPQLPPVPLDQYRETDLPADGKLSPPVTVMGPDQVKQLNWVGYFDNAKGVMAFHDPLSDVKEGTVSYLVCGWYHDPDNDPLADPDLRSLKDFKQRLADYRWSLPDAMLKEAQAHAVRHSDTLTHMGLNVRADTKATRRMSSPLDASAGKVGRMEAHTGVKVSAAAWWPRHSLYHGAVVGLGWPTAKLGGSKRSLLDAQGHEVGGPPAASTVKVALGQTLSETLGAVVARRQGEPELERLFQAFQLGAINELDEPDGRARVDALLHATTFASAPGGSTTERVWQPPLGEPEQEGGIKQPGKGVFDRYYHQEEKGVSRQTANIGSKAGKTSRAVMDEGRSYKVEVAAPKAKFETLHFKGKALAAEERVEQGGISAALKNLGLGSGKTPYRPGRWVDRDRPLPRLYNPQDPVFVLEGIKRPYHHNGDGRFSQDAMLGCRLTGSWVKSYRSPALNRSFNAEDILDRGVMNGSVPPECENLLNELILLCPGSAPSFVKAANKTAKRSMSSAVQTAETQRVMVHQTNWWGARDPRVDSSEMISRSPYGGTLPSSVAFAPPARPWNPLHLDWRVEFTPSPKGIDDWDFGECDFNEAAPKVPAKGSVQPIVIEGRSYLAAGAGKTMASAIRQTLSDALRIGDSGTLDVEAVHAYASDIGREVSRFISNIVPKSAEEGLNAQERAALGDIATALEHMDVLSGGFDGLHKAMRDPAQLQVLRAGFMRIVRMRVVDGFGQVLDLAGSSATKEAQPAQIGRSTALEVTGRPDLLALPPRFTAPSRLLLRFTDAKGGPDEARSATDKDAEVSPICGYLMPNHLDDALLFFNPDGQDVGVVRRDESDRIVWEDAPGSPSHVGASPAQAISNPFLADMAQGLLDWGVADAGLNALPNDTALRAMMRVIDTTRWSTDPFGHQGEEHLALLVGHPVVVVRAVLRLEVQETLDEDKANEQVVPVRLGSLSQWQDGLLGYFVQDNFHKLRCSEGAVGELARAFGQQEGFLQSVEDVPAYADDLNKPAALQPITHHYVDRSGEIYVRPNQDVNLILLVEPHTLVHATCGVLPRKEVGLKREWTQDALARLSPTFRFGPVLIDPKNVRMPIAAELNGSWSWDHRKDVSTWENLPVTHATQEALLPQDPPVASEGWLRLRPHDDAAQAAAPGGQP